MVDEPLPPEFQFGKVVGRVVRAVADTAQDVDALPEARPATGSVTFTPRQTLWIITTPGEKAFVTASAETADLSALGRIIDAEGRDGIWLVTGIYDVRFDLTNGAGLPSMVIEVTTDHTNTAPLDLVDDASYVPPPRTPVQTLLVPIGGPDGYLLARSGTELAWTPPPDTIVPPDATTSSKGIVQLAGDLAGTASAPTVPGLADRPDTAAVQASIDAAINADIDPLNATLVADPASGTRVALDGLYVEQAALPQGIADEIDNVGSPARRTLDAAFAHNDLDGNLVIGTTRLPYVRREFVTQSTYDALTPDPYTDYWIVEG